MLSTNKCQERHIRNKQIRNKNTTLGDSNDTFSTLTDGKGKQRLQ